MTHSEGWYYISLVLMVEVTCAEVEGDMGQPFTLACNQSTDHQAGLWLKEGRALDSGLSWQLQDGVLETSALQPSDSGNYTCLLPEFPPISTRLFVRIPDKRHVAAAPPGRLSEVHIHPSSVVATVRWKLGSDGGCPISHFTLLYCSHNSSWKLPAPPHIGPSTRQFFVYHLQPGTTYQFRLWATNRLGPGESTDVTASTTLPSDPPGIIPFSTCQMECFILIQYWNHIVKKPSGSNHERPHGTFVNHRWTPGVRGSVESGRRGELRSLIRINLNLGVTELRRSRRLQGREPILQPLPQLIEMEDDHRPTVSGSYLPYQRQRDPSTFSGDGNINPGQWLKEYERVSKYNRWDETMKLANVVFYLNGTAGRWFDNNEESLNSWRSFEDAFRGVFGLQEDSARRAEEVLKSRAQKAEESSESYIQEILSLCHQVNPRMEEGERVAHIIKGISEDTYQVLVAKDIQTVDEILKFCRHLTTVKQRRIGRTKFARLSNVMPISCVDDSDDLAALIRRIVREEIQKVFSAPEVINPLREVNALEQTVREEVSRALQPTRPQVNVVQQQPRTPYYNIDRPTQPRKTEHWRTYDDKPICFHCGRPGHVVRYCRERRQVFAEARSRNGGEGRNVGFSSRPPRYDADDDYPRKVASPKTIPVASPSFQPFSHASECEKLSGAASNGGEVAIEENPPGYIAAKLKENFVMVEINGRKIKALVDSGADFSVISDKFRRELKTPLFKEPGPILKAANKNLIETLGKCVLNIEVNGLNISFEFVVMVECSHDIIFGWDFFKATEAVIDCGRNELHLGETSVLESREEENQRLFASDDFVIPPKSIKKISVINEEICGVRDVLVSTSKDLLLRKEVLIPNSLVTFRHGRGSIWVANGASWPQLIPSGMNMCTMESYENGNICNLIESSDKLQETQLKSREWSQKINLTLDPGLSEIQRLQLVSCLDEFIGIFDFGSTPIKPTSTVKHKINTGDQSPIKQRPYRVAPSERRLIQDEVNKMIENHIVKPSESPWSSPVILVRKKDGTWRFCVDYRRLNKITKKDVYPLPRIDDALDSLAGSSYFSTMDLRSGYWQIEVDEKDREKTAFITPDGLYEFQVMPFGLCNAPATFERMIDSVLGSLKWNMCLCYLDDIVVYAPTFEEHLRHLQLVLSCIQKAGLSLNHKKCLFGSRRIKILGHLVDANGIHPDPDKVEAVSKFPRPRNISELKSFLGLCSYYRRFIENFAGKARSLHDLLKTEKQFYWDAAQEKAFEVLKTALISEPVLGHFDESADTHLHTDASGHGIGAVLLQIQGGKERPIAYASRSLTKAENNYSTTEKECLAVVWSISKFRPYLFGRPFTVVTDHHSLCWLVGQKDPSGRLARWALKLQEFDVTVIYKSGRKHKDADCLSRSPLENDQPSAVMSLTNVDIEQTKDPDLAKIIDNLNSGYTRKEFSIIDGILYKKNYSTTGRPWLMMIPKHLRSEVMADLHDAPTAGHLGFARTYDKVKKRFYWPGLYRTVRQYVSHCRECQRRKKLPRLSKDGNRWIIVCTDYMTRYAITKAIPDGGAIETAKFLVEDVILKHGAPREMITDRGRNFISQVIKEINALCGIVHRFTTAYHPQTNGLTERFNKTLGDMLSMYTGVEQKDWDQVLPYVTFAYNTAKQEATGYTPFFLVHAREAETYIDAVLPYLPDEISNDYVGELVTRAEEARQLSRSRLLQSQAKDRRLYDQKHTPVYYQKNDLVWVFTPIRKVGLSEKLLKRYFGPYKVTKKLSEVTYEVEPVDPSPRSRKAKDIVHVIRMKPYLDPEEQHSILLGNTSLCGIPPCEDDVPAGVRHLLASNSRTLSSLAWLVVVSMVTASVLVLACLSCLLIYRENASSLHLAAAGHCNIFQSYCLNPDIHAKRNSSSSEKAEVEKRSVEESKKAEVEKKSFEESEGAEVERKSLWRKLRKVKRLKQAYHNTGALQRGDGLPRIITNPGFEGSCLLEHVDCSDHCEHRPRTKHRMPERPVFLVVEEPCTDYFCLDFLKLVLWYILYHQQYLLYWDDNQKGHCFDAFLKGEMPLLVHIYIKNGIS
ncbi:hypothetical protein LAZ67_15002095 [Cordylochernes scorpioides]|uniref:RNA-directed DNA polymerase n=1 Tax=Cordylochernes scorpioides TaxID=51811 RepID=A0ABY6L9D5_9ARAC|nr:hypothetical protein LAZ67_15002095 [Cordylochernes scorpioides]